MMSESTIFLMILLLIGVIAKNNSLIISIIVLLLLKYTPIGDRVFPYLQSKGINLGVTVITIAVLVPIATGEIGFKHLGEALKTPVAWIALLSGIAVALLAKGGVNLLATSPQITAALVLGTVLSVALFKGVAVGPLIGAGIAYLFIWIVDFIK
ncbi:DUF441 domain-containing protein [Bacillus sp. JJ664]|nr:DUF441 domain-containing protein [Gottfriedia solisilvae]